MLVKRIQSQVHRAGEGERDSEKKIIFIAVFCSVFYSYDWVGKGERDSDADNYVESLKASLFNWSGEVNGRVAGGEFSKNAATQYKRERNISKRKSTCK